MGNTVIGDLGRGMSHLNRQIGNTRIGGIKIGGALQAAPLAGGVPIGVAGGYADAMGMGQKNAPPEGSVDPNLEQIKQAQVKQAKDFRANLPGMQHRMTTQLTKQNQRDLSQGIGNINQNMASRGLGYGAMNQAKQAKFRGAMSGQLAGGISDLNQGLISQADQLDANAVQTAVGIQQTQQQIQDMIYQRALAEMQGQNSMATGLMGTAVTAGLLL